MLDSVKSTIQAAQEWAARKAIGTFLKDLGGRMLTLNIDSQAKKIQVVLGPKGEDRPIRIEVEGYEILEEGGTTRIRVRGVRTDRPLYQVALGTFVEGKAFELPEPAAEWLKLFL